MIVLKTEGDEKADNHQMIPCISSHQLTPSRKPQALSFSILRGDLSRPLLATPFKSHFSELRKNPKIRVFKIES